MSVYGPSGASLDSGLHLSALLPNDPGFVPHDASLALRLDGTAVGWVMAWIHQAPCFDGNSQVWLRVHLDPDLAGTVLEQMMVTLLNELVHRVVTDGDGRPTWVRVEIDAKQDWLRDLLPTSGFQHTRTFLTMEHPVALPSHPATTVTALVPDEIPLETQLRTPSNADREMIRRAHNDAFQDHWGSGQVGVHRWQAMYEGTSETAPISNHLSRVMAAADGSIAAYALVTKPKSKVAMVSVMGTRRAYRRQGLGRILLTHCLAAAAQEPELKTLRVDVDSQSAAHRLYISVGFEPRESTLIFEKLMPAAVRT